MSRHTLLKICLFLATPFSSYSVSNAQNIYWTDSDSIKRANLDGTNEVILVSGLTDPNSITVNEASNHIFWTAGIIPGTILRANLDGLSVTTIFNTGLVFPFSIEVDSVNEKLYWVNNDNPVVIQRSNLDGSNAVDLVTGLGSAGIIGIALDVSGEKIYISNKEGPSIQRVNMDGTNLVDLVTTSIDKPNDIAIDLTNGKLYWTDGGLNKIVRSDLDGTNVVDVASTTGAPLYMDIDIPNGHIYFHTANAGIFTVDRINFDGTGLTSVITSQVGGLTLGPEPPDVPTVSQWGLIILLLMILSAGSVLITHRNPTTAHYL